MFPTGMPGISIALLRFLVAAAFMVDGSPHGSLTRSTTWFALYLILSVGLCAGVFTPCCCVLCMLLQLRVLVMFGSHDTFHLMFLYF